MAYTWSNELDPPYTATFRPYSLLGERRISEDIQETDDDLCDEVDLEEDGKAAQSSNHTSISSEDAVGLIRYYFYEAGQILSHPVTFFRTMPTRGGLAEPSVFLLLSSGIFSLVSAIARMDALEFFRTLLSTNGAVVIAASLSSLILNVVMAGRGNFESTFRVFAYSKATLLFAWVGVGNVQIGGWFAFAYSLVMSFIGLKRVHKLPAHLVACVVVVVAILQALIMRTFNL